MLFGINCCSLGTNTVTEKYNMFYHCVQQTRKFELLFFHRSSAADCVQASCRRMWGSVVVLFLSLIKSVKENQLLETPLEEMLFKYWSTFTGK